jgi:cysteinyl-tRNA synthetase
VGVLTRLTTTNASRASASRHEQTVKVCERSASSSSKRWERCDDLHRSIDWAVLVLEDMPERVAWFRELCKCYHVRQAMRPSVAAIDFTDKQRWAG